MQLSARMDNTHDLDRADPADSHSGGPGPAAPSVLALSSHLPWPLNSGGSIRSFHLLRALAKRFRVRLAAPGNGDLQLAIQALAAQGIAVKPVALASRSRLGEIFRLAGAMG